MQLLPESDKIFITLWPHIIGMRPSSPAPSPWILDSDADADTNTDTDTDTDKDLETCLDRDRHNVLLMTSSAAVATIVAATVFARIAVVVDDAYCASHKKRVKKITSIR